MRATDFHGAAEGGWADPVGNDTVIPSDAFLDILAKLVQGRFPPRLLPSFLHEATHHWCFDSPLGYLVAGFFLRSRQHALTFGTSTENAWDLLDDYLRYWTTVRLLRPLAEGMALFAEHDLNSSPDEELFPAYFNFALTKVGRTRDLNASLSEAEQTFNAELFALRTGGESLARKMDLYVRPLTGEDGYLVGYLTVKFLWKLLIQKSSRFLQPGLYLCFLRARIYESEAIQLAVADPGSHDQQIPSTISTAIQKQLYSLVDVTDEEAREFERRTLGRNFDFRSYPFENGAQTPVEAAHEALQRSLAPGDGDDELQRSLTYDNTNTFNRRHLMRVFSIDVLLKQHPSGRLSVHDVARTAPLPFLNLVPEAPLTSLEARGTLEYHVSFTLGTELFLLFVDGQIIASLPARCGDTEALLAYAYPALDTLRQQRDKTNSVMRSILDDASTAAIAQWADEAIADSVDRIYRRLALHTTTDEAEDVLAETLADNGLWAILGEERLLRAVAVTSALTSHRMPLSPAINLSELGVTQTDIDEAASKMNAAGLPFIASDGRTVVCLLA